MLEKILIALLVLLAAYYWNATKEKIAPLGETVPTTSGDVQGIITESRDGRPVYEWRGIPYAEPPVGNLRFQSPKPKGKWDGVLKATSYGSACTQLDFTTGTRLGTEDCLFLNVYTPQDTFHKAKKQDGRLLPVVVSIHGGGFFLFSSDSYTPEYFMDEDVVFVSMNYRLGIFGFLSTGDHVVRGNMGLKDQALALRWVKENIVEFGGDPEQITIIGESAGSASCHYQLLYPKNKGIVKRAMLSSGTVFDPWSRTDVPLENAKIHAEAVGCPSAPVKAMIDCFVKMDASTLVQAQVKIANPEREKTDLFDPVVEAIKDDDAFLTEDPNKLYAEGKVLDVPIIIGVTTEEGLMVTAEMIRNETFRTRVAENIFRLSPSLMTGSKTDKGKVDTEALKKFYLGHHDNFDPLEPSAFKALTQFASDRLFVNGMRKTLKLHSQLAPVYPYIYGKKGPSFVDEYLDFPGVYNLYIEIGIHLIKKAWHSLVPPSEDNHYGVNHGDDLAMLFIWPGIFEVGRNNRYYDFSKSYVKTVASFAGGLRGEFPKFKGVEFPQVFESSAERYIYIDDEPRIIQFPYTERFQFWKKFNLSW